MARTRPKLTEQALVARLCDRFKSDYTAIRVGIGDDAAVIAGLSESCVVSVDSSVEGVHFERRWLGFEAIGHRAFHAAASDLAAMGARPVAALSSLIVPQTLTSQQLDALTIGQQLASTQCACPVVGGNIARGRDLSITTTVLGTAERPMRRDTARPGEQLWLVGRAGLAAAGLAGLRLGAATDGSSLALAECVEAWRCPTARLKEGQLLAEVAGSCIDLSDGLAADAGHLARQSGVAVVVDRRALRATLSPALVGAARRLRRSPLGFALSGGEDYGLLATGAARRRPLWAQPIGWVSRGRGAWLLADGRRVPLAGGHDHLSGP